MSSVSAGRRGQASLEYLMNYTWVLALLIVVGAAIFSLNLTDISFSLSGSGSGFSQQFEQVSVTGHIWKVDEAEDRNDTLELALQNNGDNEVTVQRVNLTEIEDDPVSNVTDNSTTSSLFPGERTTRVLQINKTLLGITRSAGDPYEVTVEVTYRDDTADQQYTTSGPLRGEAGLA